MKKVFSVLCALVVLSMGAFAQGPQGPQGPRRGGDNGWRERVRAEKVARYYVAEEKFRHQQIGRLGNGNFPNLRMSEEQKQQWRERGEQMREQFRNWTGQKKENE